jgi:hypothetical protein
LEDGRKGERDTRRYEAFDRHYRDWQDASNNQLGQIPRRNAKMEEQEGQAQRIREGDLVLQRISKAKQMDKMYSKLEGPFIIASMARSEAYRLHTLEGTEDPYSWNKDMLQNYYV